MAIHGLWAGYPGAIPRAARGFEYLYVTIHKFTKWPKGEPVRKVTAQSAVKFIK